MAGPSVVLDIGQDVGALVLYTPPAFAGREIEVSPAGDEAARVHTEVRERTAGGRTLFAGVYAQLRAGTYRAWTEDPALPSEVTIEGGQVAELDWR